MPHSTLELISRALAKEGQRLRWRSRQALNPVTVAVSQKNQSSVARILFFLSAPGTFCAPPAAVSALTNFWSSFCSPDGDVGGRSVGAFAQAVESLVTSFVTVLLLAGTRTQRGSHSLRWRVAWVARVSWAGCPAPSPGGRVGSGRCAARGLWSGAGPCRAKARTAAGASGARL